MLRNYPILVSALVHQPFSGDISFPPFANHADVSRARVRHMEGTFLIVAT
jgi:hypothetical protein